ncbi:putative late blight resistance protein homolog R1A-10 [Trifolium pratense]|uniref:putative late blight resistance protein homolog R1A-10 n=1 Tax=Trifolium pratense TaxID=57577 RepID=UPI001E6913F4|nr:putative late blight resistance protein homolog R1A-10 [Trifolium pratense]
MADTVVNLLLTNLTQLLKDEAKLLSGVEEKVLLLQQELGRINAFLRGSEGKRDGHEVVKAVVGQIRDVAYEAQDVIDNYVVDVVHHRIKEGNSPLCYQKKKRKKEKKGKPEKFFHNFKHGTMLHNVNNQIEMIKSKIKDIYDNKDKYDINEGESVARAMEALTMAEMVERRRREVEEDEVVGFDRYATEIINLIVKENTSREVLSIIGMVGCGKTTLARKVYKDPQISKLFDCCAWEFVTKDFNAKELLLSLLRSFEAIPEDELKRIKKEKNEEESESNAKTQEITMLKNTLRDYLSDMRYLIVLDDMWSSQVLEDIGDAFPDDNMGSRILITSRSEEVASKICTIEPYKLKPLNDEDSWILLSKKVFRGEKCPPNLETVGRIIANACKGLPLSIVVIARILRSKEKSERVWEKVTESVNWFINKEDTLVKEIIRLGYEILPRRLKPCFLYFGIYPEDYEIPVRQLIQLWIAEGFITETGNERMTEEDVAEEYLEELIRRNLIQAESRRTDGGVKTCRIHDLLRDLCMSESIEDNFSLVRTDVNILKEGKPRRLSLHGSTSYYMSEGLFDHSSTRSLFIFSKDEYEGHYFKDWIQKNFKLIQVLDMGPKVLLSSCVLEEIEESIHLRYLRTGEYTNTFSFPKSIYNLWNLETLDLRGSQVINLPDGIWKLKKLRHLYMSGWNATLPNIPGRKVLPNLQTLSVVCLNEKTVEQLEKGKFPNLKKLGVDCLFCYETNPIDYLRRLQCLTHLNTLKVLFISSALTDVEGFPPNLTKITLNGGDYMSETVNRLGSLSKLRYLKISGQRVKLKLECTKSGCFPQLLVLKMTNLDLLSWNLAEGSMPHLRRLVFNNCQFTTNIPSVESFPSLKEIEIL